MVLRPRNWEEAETFYAHSLYKILLNNCSCWLANNNFWMTFSSLHAYPYVQKIQYINWNFFQMFQDAQAQTSKDNLLSPRTVMNGIFSCLIDFDIEKGVLYAWAWPFYGTLVRRGPFLTLCKRKITLEEEASSDCQPGILRERFVFCTV